MPWTFRLFNPRGPRHQQNHRKDHIVQFPFHLLTFCHARIDLVPLLLRAFTPAHVNPSEDTHPVVELGTAIILGWQVEDGVVVRMSGIQKRPDIFDVVPESQLNAFSRKRHHWKGREKPGWACTIRCLWTSEPWNITSCIYPLSSTYLWFSR